MNTVEGPRERLRVPYEYTPAREGYWRLGFAGDALRRFAADFGAAGDAAGALAGERAGARVGAFAATFGAAGTSPAGSKKTA